MTHSSQALEHHAPHMQEAVRIPRGRVLANLGAHACLSLLLLTTACGGGGGSSVDTAQIAVRANPALDLVATDDRQGVLTVRVKRTGQILTVRAADVTAGTAFKDLDVAGTGSSSPAASGSASAEAPREGQAGPATSGVEVSSGSRRVAVQQTPNGVTVQGSGTSSRTGASSGSSGGRVAVRQGGGTVAVEGSGTGSGSTAAPPGSSVAVGTTSGGGLSVSTPAGQVTIGALQDATRPAGSRPAPSAPPAPVPERQASAAQMTQAGAHIDEGRLEHRTRTVVCVGNDNVTLDNVLLRTENAAIQASGNCKITVRNSHIAADIGMQVSGNTDVTIENSIIEGRTSSLQLVGDSTASVQSSTVRGGVQKVQNAKLRDQGNNLWR